MTIWTNVSLEEELMNRLRSSAAPHELVQSAEAKSSNLAVGSTDAACRTADIAFGQPAVDDLLGSTSLQFIQLTTAGYTRFDRDDLRAAMANRGAALCSSSGVFDDPCAQHVLSFMLAHNRRLHDSLLDQQTARSWRYSDLRPAVRTLGEQNVLLVGFGAIALRLLELLAPFKPNVRGVRRTVAGNEPVPTFKMGQLAEQLPWADHIVNLLPSGPGNTAIFNSELLGRTKPGAAFYNVGRGDTVDQTALLAALNEGQLGGAYLDVTDPEPLPKEHPLWSAPRCMITPHTAGGTQGETAKLVDHFLRNLSRWMRKEKLVNRVI